MGSTHRVHCECGFDTQVTVGGGGRTFMEDSKFPFHCATCGIVSVNIAKLASEDSPPCPRCSGSDMCQCGKSPASIPFVEPPPPSFWSLLVNQLAEWASKVGIKLPFGRIRKVNPERPLTGRVTTAADGNRLAFHWGDYEAFALDNRCPACRQMTLIFESMPSVMFD